MTDPTGGFHIGDEVEVVIEVTRGSFVKRRPDGSVDFVSPLPCPYNYGSVPETRAADGDPIDALVLGPALERGERVRVPVRAVVRFIDAGAEDLKLVCSPVALTNEQRHRIDRFFRLYVRFKQALNTARRRPGATRYEGIQE